MTRKMGKETEAKENFPCVERRRSMPRKFLISHYNGRRMLGELTSFMLHDKVNHKMNHHTEGTYESKAKEFGSKRLTLERRKFPPRICRVNVRG